MIDLVACPQCNVYLKVFERRCPHCGGALPADRSMIGATATALLLGLSLSSCSKIPEPADVYGAAPSDDFDDKKDAKQPDAKKPDAKKPDAKQPPAKSEPPP